MLTFIFVLRTILHLFCPIPYAVTAKWLHFPPIQTRTPLARSLLLPSFDCVISYSLLQWSPDHRSASTTPNTSTAKTIWATHSSVCVYQFITNSAVQFYRAQAMAFLPCIMRAFTADLLFAHRGFIARFFAFIKTKRVFDCLNHCFRFWHGPVQKLCTVLLYSNLTSHKSTLRTLSAPNYFILCRSLLKFDFCTQRTSNPF